MPNKRPSRRSRKGAHICKHCKQNKHRNHSFKKYSHKKHKHCRHTRRTRRRGGAEVFVGAPVESSLAGDWSSRMSQGQGADYLRYHQGQHGGGITGAPYPTAVMDSRLPGGMVASSMTSGLDKAIADVAGLRDMAGGRRTRGRRGRRTRGRRGRRTRGGRRRRGGALGYAPNGSNTMLLSPSEYAQAGLNPEWTSAAEFTDAQIRQSE